MLNLPPEPDRNRHGIPKLPGPAPDAKDSGVEVARNLAKPKKLAPAPEQPPWCDDETWAQLLAMRKRLQR